MLSCISLVNYTSLISIAVLITFWASDKEQRGCGDQRGSRVQLRRHLEAGPELAHVK